MNFSIRNQSTPADDFRRPNMSFRGTKRRSSDDDHGPDAEGGAFLDSVPLDPSTSTSCVRSAGFENKKHLSSELWLQRCNVEGDCLHTSFSSTAWNARLVALVEGMENHALHFLSRILYVLSVCDCDVVTRLYCMNLLRSLLPILDVERYRSGAVTIVLDTMRRSPGSLVVQIESCRCLSFLYKKPEEFEANAKEGLLVLLGSLELHQDATLVVLVLDLIRRLSTCLTSHSDWEEAPRVILVSLYRHPTVVSIQQIGSCLLAWLAEDSSCRHRIIHYGGVDFITTLMVLHGTDSLISCNAAAALSWLVHAGALEMRPVLTESQVATVMDTISTHIDNDSVFGNCVCILCGLARLSNEKEFLQVVLKGMKMHISSAKVQECCLRLLRFRSPQTCLPEMAESICTILRGMAEHPNDAHLQAQACDVLAFMADVPGLQDNLFEQGAVDAVLKALQLHRSELRVRQGAMWFLTLLLPRQGTSSFGGNFLVVETVWSGVSFD